MVWQTNLYVCGLRCTEQCVEDLRYSVQALFTLYGFTFPITVALLQMAVIAPVCYIVARPKLEWGLARGIIPLAVVNVLNVVCGLIGEPEVSLSLGRGLVHAV